MKTQSILPSVASTALAPPPTRPDLNVKARPTLLSSTASLTPSSGLLPAMQPLGTSGALAYQGFIQFADNIKELLLPPPSYPSVVSTG
ncbi:hypothetical protein AOQ84DRAFT_222102 [Glonium stellatum]|uniref:Uncharacterized protein n=1 Tax=Glonium stellatum TaxID=574774 RepID=A0A8E2F0T2_9PEZI|nr:hypothetical protein AOQ84DRAFT_222102 [Glonium stellatum]